MSERLGNDAFNRASYGMIADRYALYRPEYPDALFDEIIQHVTHRRVALDCATGTGQSAAKLVGRFDRVLASDSSAEQVKRLPHLPGLYGLTARSEALPIRAGCVDLVTVAQAVHWFDIEQFWTEVHRIASPGAVVTIWGYGFFKVDPEIDEIVMRTLRKPVARYWGSGNLILLHEYRTISFPFEEIPAKPIVMEQKWTLDRLLRYVGTWSALTRYEKEHGQDLLGPARAALETLWPEGDTKTVRMPVTLRIGRVR